MWSSSWLRNCNRSAPTVRRRTQTSSHRGAGFRPRMEALEDRCLFSVLTVTSLQDSGAGSLRAEIAAAQSGDTLVFSPALFSSSSTVLSAAAPLSSAKIHGSGKTTHGKPTSTPPPPPPPPPTPAIALTTGELDLTKNLTIQGPGAGQLIISGWGSNQRAFEVGPTATVTLSGLTIAGTTSAWTSYPNAAPWDGYGGGILNHGTLTVSACTVSGVIYGYNSEGGGIFNDGTLMLSGCTVSNCDAQGTATSGGGISNWGTATLTNTTISNNMADPSWTTSYPWFNRGGGILNQGTMTLNGCAVSGNDARRAGGGIFNSGALTLVGSAVYGNATEYGGGIYNSGTLTLEYASSATGNNDAYAADVDNVGTLTVDDTSKIGTRDSVVAPLGYSE